MDSNKDKQMRIKSKPLLILLEGLDCSGKKTTGRLLQKRLSEKGISATMNVGALTSKIYKYVSNLVSLHKCPNAIRSLVYSLDGYGDHLWYKGINEQIVIQISSPMRNWAYALANKEYFRIFTIPLIKKQLAKYDIVWYMTAPYNLRIDRHRYQVERQENSDDLKKRFKSEEFFFMHETALKKILIEKNMDKMFDTSIYSSDEITNYMLDYIINNYRYLIIC